jgi:glycosyltransferase involved in cell wall biosynthesis
MKLLLVHNHYSVNGGEDVVYHNELQALKSCLPNEDVFEYKVSVNEMSKWYILKNIFFSNKIYRDIFRIVKHNKIDIVHVHNFFPILTGSAFKAASDAGAKVVHTLHNYRWWCLSGNFYRNDSGICMLCTQKKIALSGIQHKCYRNSYVQSMIAQLAFWNYRRINVFNYIDRFIVLSDFQKDLLLKLGLDAHKIIFKPNMVSTLTPATPLTKTKHYLFVGRLDHSKGIELLLQTWATLPAHFIIEIVGSGILEKELKNKYSQLPNIIFKGELSHPEVVTSMQSAQYTIQSSLLYETFGLTIVESMSLGTPVIGFNIGTRPELIKDRETGFITTPDNLFNTIIESNNHPDYDWMCVNAKNYARQFTSDKLLSVQLNAYSELLFN